MEQIHINHLAVISCAVANLVWADYGTRPYYFTIAWKRENNLSDEQLKN